MATITPHKRHPALEVDVAERVDYLMVVASMAAADGLTSDDELDRLRAMCAALLIEDGDQERVVAAARSPESVALDEILGRLRSSKMRYALLVDAVSIAYADNEFDVTESEELMALAGKLDIPRAHAVLVQQYVADRRKRGPKAPSDTKTTAKLVGAGIPVAALTVATAVGVPFAVGVGLAAALGVSSYVSVKLLFRHLKTRR